MSEDFIKDYEYYRNVSLKKYNTYHLDALAGYLFYPDSISKLSLLLKHLKEEKINYLILGNGSNIILARPYYEVVIRLDRLNKITFTDNLVTAEAGVSLVYLANECMKKGLSGLEFAGGIPGQVGASTAMNAGAYKGDIGSLVKSVKVLNPNNEVITMTSGLDFSYRNSFFKKNRNYICVEVTLELTKGNSEEIKKLMDDRRERRITSQPLNKPSAGSVFRNPEGLSAGKLIEDLGLKGYTIGGATISEKHANFIINNGDATADDIIKLINHIKKEVKKEYNIDLILEQEIIG